MEQYLIDTNVVSDYFSLTFNTKAVTFIDEIINNVPNISVITQIELRCWKINNAIEEQIKSFIEDSKVYNITSEIIDHCVILRKDKKIKTPDAIIAATALAFNFTIITNNEKDFANIKG